MIRLSNVLFFNSANNKRLLAVYSSLISLILTYPIVNTYLNTTINMYVCMYVCMYVWDILFGEEQIHNIRNFGCFTTPNLLPKFLNNKPKKQKRSSIYNTEIKIFTFYN